MVIHFFGKVDDSLSTQFVSPGCTKYWVPKCSVGLKSFVGQVFPSVPDAISFYTDYARTCGFSIRFGSEKRFPNRFIQSKRFHCNREGVCGKGADKVKSFVEHHNHKLAETVGKKFLKVNRSMTVAHQSFAFNTSKVKIGPLKSFGLMKELLGGYDKVGATAVDFKNWNRDFRASNGDFYYEYDANNCGKLTKLFWADFVGRRNYDVFGDVISVDATFNTNKYNMVFVPFCGVDNHRKCVTFATALLSKEDFESYKWFFQAFVKAMVRHSLCILTDQCAAMKQEIANVFDKEKTRHRLCMWYIMKKLPSKVGVVLCMDGGFFSSLKSFVWGENLDASEFEAGWKSVLEAYDLTDNH
ncbi:hypothetical protein POM88_025338 [Heracleum sosnowskyi]|uniref:MULE transposase domain-containing protein n=1 Tax=Heracleum sosnowskyi TaxID=360622 RepID=A0AAD8I3T1_9APIA|nr:hypothetical protein POM88_025338 [Heracleum sosnowskyi]